MFNERVKLKDLLNTLSFIKLDRTIGFVYLKSNEWFHHTIRQQEPYEIDMFVFLSKLTTNLY